MARGKQGDSGGWLSAVMAFFGKYFLTPMVARIKIRLMKIMKKLTNRGLASSFGVSLTQVKRWSGFCLGRDPEADQAGGVRREYTLDDAFMIFLFGEVLVGRFRMGLREAQMHIEKIKPELIAEKLLPSNLDFELPLNIINLMPIKLIEKCKDIMTPTPYINIIILGKNDYLIEWEVVKSNDYVELDEKHYAEKYSVIKYFPSQFPMSVRDGQQYVIELDVYLQMFAELFLKWN